MTLPEMYARFHSELSCLMRGTIISLHGDGSKEVPTSMSYERAWDISAVCDAVPCPEVVCRCMDASVS